MSYIGKLHVLTNQEVRGCFSHIKLVKLAIEGGAGVIQFRQKVGSIQEMVKTACQIKTLCHKAGVQFIVNDRLDVTLASEADGIHIGREDFSISLARVWLGTNKIIGSSASTLAEVFECRRQCVDYIGFGPIFPTFSKLDAGPVSGLNLLREVTKQVNIPIIAIGGIENKNAELVMQAGSHGIAVIRAVSYEIDSISATRKLNRICNLKYN